MARELALEGGGIGKGVVRSRRRAGAVACLCLGGALALGACSPIVEDHGYVPLREDLAAIDVGRDTRETVAETLGTPSAFGVIDDRGYFYVSQRIRQRGYRAPEVTDREIVAISFDGRGVVSNIERFGLEDGNVVALSRRVTDSNVQNVGFIRQLLGNIGRVDTSSLGGGPVGAGP
jgi:outer membrane protein assembly factor BamE (lipoprotein component of BamABCDE complex)